MAEMKQKKLYNVYQIREYTDSWGHVTRERKLVGKTMAVSQAKARVNVEYRLRGKAQYCGYDIYDTGWESCVKVFYEAEEAA